jgi:hypothetical protein
MPSTDAPNWWADVQQEREDLAGPGRRPADDWLGEDIDFVPRRRMSRAAVAAGSGLATATVIDLADLDNGPSTSAADAAHPLHGVFVPTAHEPVHLSAADDPFATPPPPVGTRRTVQIKGRPAENRTSMAQRHRGRTASDRVGPRPDRIALWAVALGAILILLAAMTSSSQAAVAHRAATAPAVSAKVAHHAPLRAAARHR